MATITSQRSTHPEPAAIVGAAELSKRNAAATRAPGTSADGDTELWTELQELAAEAAEALGDGLVAVLLGGDYGRSEGTLTLRAGTHGPLESGIQINFQGAQPEALANQSIHVETNASQAAHVTLRWKTDGQVQKTTFENGYALRLEFGALANNHLPGKIYLCLPDPEKSYLMGTFNADARKPKPKAAPPAK